MFKARKNFIGVGIVLGALSQTSLAIGVCEQYREEIERTCGTGFEFIGLNGNRNLLITGIDTLDQDVGNEQKEVCLYRGAPGLMSIHRISASCEERLDMAANLCYRDGLTRPENMSIEEIRATKVCEPKKVIHVADEPLSKVFLWGAGYLPTKDVILIDNIGGFVELRENLLYEPGVSDVNETRVRIKFDDPRFPAIWDSLGRIRIEYLTPEQCYEHKAFTTMELKEVSVMMRDGTDPETQVIYKDGEELNSDPCVDIQGFFPNFQNAVDQILAP